MSLQGEDGATLTVIDDAYGREADLYRDVLGVNSNATLDQIQGAYFDRRNELYEVLTRSLNNGDNDDDTLEGLRSSSEEEDSSEQSERLQAERKMDAIVMAMRILGDPELRIQYDDLRTERIRHVIAPRQQEQQQRNKRTSPHLMSTKQQKHQHRAGPTAGRPRSPTKKGSSLSPHHNHESSSRSSNKRQQQHRTRAASPQQQQHHRSSPRQKNKKARSPPPPPPPPPPPRPVEASPSPRKGILKNGIKRASVVSGRSARPDQSAAREGPPSPRSGGGGDTLSPGNRAFHTRKQTSKAEKDRKKQQQQQQESSALAKIMDWSDTDVDDLVEEYPRDAQSAVAVSPTNKKRLAKAKNLQEQDQLNTPVSLDFTITEDDDEDDITKDDESTKTADTSPMDTTVESTTGFGDTTMESASEFMRSDEDEEDTQTLLSEDVSESDGTFLTVRGNNPENSSMFTRMKEELLGTIEDTTAALSQVFTVFTLQEEDIVAVTSQIHKAQRQIRRGL